MNAPLKMEFYTHFEVWQADSSSNLKLLAESEPQVSHPGSQFCALPARHAACPQYKWLLFTWRHGILVMKCQSTKQSGRHCRHIFFFFNLDTIQSCIHVFLTGRI